MAIDRSDEELGARCDGVVSERKLRPQHLLACSSEERGGRLGLDAECLLRYLRELRDP